jgi:DNA-binding transcriptional ArsR family regulator
MNINPGEAFRSCIPLSQPAISHHLKILRDNKLVVIEKHGTQRFYSLQINEAIEQLESFVQFVKASCPGMNPQRSEED